ncbi:MAG: bifunctional (p)ppGpp synthetase/guanosine-3',5'-bis(diphosphate) 3'-pyrophosphohydrolase [Lachnospiraceae bacterium]|nr:bifunctional (p)ppGpp synthetase/guanosine-3',5'-bis(diphosphate) 3'-pyrophosphohydrolase [Lachnospiraceae bacterium]
MAEAVNTAQKAGTELNTVLDVPAESGDGRRLPDSELIQIRIADASAKAMQDFTSPEELYGELVASIRKYHPSDDISMVEKAYRIASDAHSQQKRKSGEPYIIHPLCVAIILADLELDKETIVAGLLHDVVEDTIMTEDEIREQFGPEVALLVDGVTKLGRLSYSSDKLDTQAENLRKMFLAMAKDIRVIMIKLADRLHNMRTLQYMRPEKQKEKARETREIYAPIAQRLGISKIKVELDDLSLKYLEPEVYYDLVEKVSLKKGERQMFIEDIVRNVEVHISKAGIHAEIYGRAKHLFSIYKKMVNQGKTIDQIYDLFAVRIIVDTVRDCYGALGVIHEMYKPVPGRFKDYIAMPKQNMYQSLHTTLIGPGGTPFEIQIRTFDMHRVAEYGIAAHWKYKEASDGKKVSTQQQEEEKLTWLRQILEWQQESDNKEFMSLLKSDLNLFNDSVYCFTPSGDVKTLPNGSTPIDFAYSIHSAVGNNMVGARVNGKLVTIDYQIQNGDRIEIITSQNSKGPSADWLKIVRSTQAKNKINQWFKHERKEDNIIRGKEMLSAFCKAKGLNLPDLLKPEYTEAVTKKYGFRDWESVLAAIGHGGLKEGQIVNKLQEAYDKDHVRALTDEDILNHSQKEGRPKVSRSRTGVIVKGMEDVSVRLSKCCSPVPGDEIVGFITRGRGVTVHRKDCVNVTTLPDEEKVRLIDVEWSKNALRDEGGNGKLYYAEIRIFAHNRTGLLVDITKIFTERHIDVRSVSSRMSRTGTVTISYEFQVPGRDALSDLIGKIRQVESVIDIIRTAG